MKPTIFTIAFTIVLVLSSCDSKPTIIRDRPVSNKRAVLDESKNYPTSDVSMNNKDKIHVVRIIETKDTERYTYLKVNEEGTDYWIAVARQNVNVGGSYYYKGGIFKHNFKSPELGTIFEVLYLVSEITEHPTVDSSAPRPVQVVSSKKITTTSLKSDTVSLAELFADPAFYKGKQILIKGKCVKVNNSIMNRNWIHIQDESGEKFDLTATTKDLVEINSDITLEGTIALNVDFGAGYLYEIILENATVK